MTDVAEQEIRTMITAYVKDTRTAWIAKDLFAVERNWNKYAADKSVIMIRPSGNPLTFDGVKGKQNNSFLGIRCKNVENTIL